MKLHIKHSEFGFNRKTMDLEKEDLMELIVTFLNYQFPQWDIDTAFNMEGIEYFDDHIDIEIHVLE